ncbi:MAG: DMT family transporter [Bacteroidota bacterium]
MKPFYAELSLFLVTFIWGGTFVFTKIGLDFTSPSVYILMRFSIAIFLCVFFFNKKLFKIQNKTLINGLILGLFFGGGFLLQTIGLKYTTVSKSAFITGITVPLTPIVYYIVCRKKINKYSFWGVFVAMIGLWIFTNPDFDNINIGDVLTLFSTMFWAFYITYMDVFTKKIENRSITAQLVFLQFVASSIIALVYFVTFEDSSWVVKFDNMLLISLAFNAVLASFFVTFIHTSIQRYTTPVKAALIFSLEPIVASSVAVIFLNETMSNTEIFGATLLFSAVIISELGTFLEKNGNY